MKHLIKLSAVAIAVAFLAFVSMIDSRMPMVMVFPIVRILTGLDRRMARATSSVKKLAMEGAKKVLVSKVWDRMLETALVSATEQAPREWLDSINLVSNTHSTYRNSGSNIPKKIAAATFV